MSLPTVTVAGTINNPDGTPLDGKWAYFTTTAEMVDAAGNVLVPILTVKAKVVAGQLLAADGENPLVLYASTTGVNTVPYSVRESWSRRSFTVNLLTSDVVSGHIAYSTLGPVSPAPDPSSPYADLSDVEARDVAVLAEAEDYTDAGLSSKADTSSLAPVATSGVYSDLTGKPTLGTAAAHAATDFDAAGAAAAAQAAAIAASAGQVTKAAVIGTGLTATDIGGMSSAQIATAIGVETSRAEAVEAGKADRSGPGATVPRNQLPNISGSFWQQVANQAAMLALTAPDADTALIVFRTDTPGTVWFLNPGLAPGTLGNWGSYQDDAAGAAAAVQTNLTAEATTARSAESANATAISAEATTARAAEALKAPLVSPALTGSPTAPTPSAGDNSSKLAPTAYVDRAVATQHTADNAAYEALLPIIEGLPLVVRGHSYDVTPPVANQATSGAEWPKRIAGRHLMAATNDALYGSFMVDLYMDALGDRVPASRHVPGSTGLVTVNAVINDATVATTDPTHAAVLLVEFNNALRGLLSLLSCSVKTEESTASFAYTGTWASFAGSDNSGSAIKYTATQNDFVDITFTGDSVTLLISGWATGTGGTCTVKNGATVLATINTDGQAYIGVRSGRNFIAIPYKISGLGAGSHTVRVTKTDAGAGLVAVDAYLTPSSKPPTVIVVKGAPIAATDISTQLALFNAALVTICADFSNAIVTDPVAYGWDKTTCIGPDGTHPNDRGHAVLAATVEGALATIAYRAGLNVGV